MLHRRTFLRTSLGLAGASLLAAGGCNLVAMGMYIVTGNNTPPEFDDLRGKKVAVVCRPITSLDFNNSSVANVLAAQVGTQLKMNIKLDLVDARRVNDWTDENTWEEYVEIGKALGADYVVGIDLENFNLYQGQTLYQGQANISFAVYDMTKGKDPVYEKHLPQAVFPPSGGIPASELPENQFRRKFLAVLADRIARHFYSHDSTADFAPDSTVLN